MIIEHQTRDEHHNPDSLTKKTEFYEQLEEEQADQVENKDGFFFLDKDAHEKLPFTRLPEKSEHSIPGLHEIRAERVSKLKMMEKGDPFLLDLLACSNLV